MGFGLFCFNALVFTGVFSFLGASVEKQKCTEYKIPTLDIPASTVLSVAFIFIGGIIILERW